MLKVNCEKSRTQYLSFFPTVRKDTKVLVGGGNGFPTPELTALHQFLLEGGRSQRERFCTNLPYHNVLLLRGRVNLTPSLTGIKGTRGNATPLRHWALTLWTQDLRPRRAVASDTSTDRDGNGCG